MLVIKKSVYKMRSGAATDLLKVLVLTTLILLILIFNAFKVIPLKKKINDLRVQTVALSVLAVKKSGLPSKNLNPAEQLMQYYQFFPRQKTTSDGMAKLYNAAALQNLNLEQGEYRLAQDRDENLARYDIVLPIKGGYVQFRKFIAQALVDVPNLSLDGVTFGRQKISDSAVDAQLKMTLYVRQE